MTSHQVKTPPVGKTNITVSQADNINEKRQSSDEEDVSNRAKDNTGYNVNRESFSRDPPITSSKINAQQDITQAKRLHPFVHWAQSPSHISLRVDLSQAKDLRVCLADGYSCLEFSAKGIGAHGLQEYYFSLELHSQVDKEIVSSQIERYVLLLIKKSQQQVSWPRLTKQSTRLSWLRVDFDRFEGDDTDDNETDEDNYNTGAQFSSGTEYLSEELLKHGESYQAGLNTGNQSQASNLRKSNLNIFNSFGKRIDKNVTKMNNIKNQARYALDCRKTYLFLYNLVMFIMFLKVFIVLIVKGLNGTADDDIIQSAASIIKFMTYTQLLETVHPILGLVPGGPMMPFTQSIGRLLVNYYLTEPTIRLNSAPYAHYLFIVWSSIEVFRYSFYALRVFGLGIHYLTWCRYTLFLPLYPLGGLCESMVLLSTIKHYEETGEYSISLPNAANASFHLPSVLRVYIFVLLGPTIYMLMRHMWAQRSKQLKAKAD